MTQYVIYDPKLDELYILDIECGEHLMDTDMYYYVSIPGVEFIGVFHE